MPATLAQLDAELTTIEGIDTTLGKTLNTLISDFEAKTTGSGVDVSAELTRLQNIATALTSIESTATAADPGPVSGTTGTIGSNPTTTSLSVSPTTVWVGTAAASVSLSASVTGNGTDPLSGDVTFLKNGASFSGAAVDANGNATATDTITAAGTVAYTASYIGDTNNAPSTSTEVDVVAS